MNHDMGIGFLFGFGLAYGGYLLSTLHGRWRRRHKAEISIDTLFDAVAQGHMTSEEAVREILRRRHWG